VRLLLRSSLGKRSAFATGERVDNTDSCWFKVIGVIDIDCADLQGFDSVDQEWLERLAKIVATGETCYNELRSRY